jgi:hypothetical protein
MPYDPNDGNNPNICGAPWNEDDEGNCDCSGCRHRRHKRAKEEYDEDHGPDYDDEHRMELDELSEAGRQRRMDRMIDAADFKRKEAKEDALLNSMKGE